MGKDFDDAQFLKDIGIEQWRPPTRKPVEPVQPPQITQTDLACEMVLRKKARAAGREWRSKKREILARLQSGAEVEPGPITVEFDIRVRM